MKGDRKPIERPTSSSFSVHQYLNLRVFSIVLRGHISQDQFEYTCTCKTFINQIELKKICSIHWKTKNSLDIHEFCLSNEEIIYKYCHIFNNKL